MSTNDKNKIRPAFLMNFTNNILNRIIVAADTYSKKDDINNRIGLLNESINLIIQNLNLLIKDRNIPYIKAKAFFSQSDAVILERDTRIIIDKYPVDEIYDENIKKILKIPREEISHIVDILIAPGQKLFSVSSLSCDARLILDYSYFNDAITDILLDISVFNSYSFLRCMDIESKKIFSSRKLKFCLDRNIEFYNIEEGEQQYFSLAFVAREGNGKLNLEKYILLWDEFLNAYYSEFKHNEESINNQLLLHKDIKELPKNCAKKISENGEGSYLLLRTNKDRTESIHPQLYSLFGINKNRYRKGLIHIVSIEKYNEIINLLENLDVSAFKIIV